jgi:hypothetical protein
MAEVGKRANIAGDVNQQDGNQGHDHDYGHALFAPPWVPGRRAKG